MWDRQVHRSIWCFCCIEQSYLSPLKGSPRPQTCPSGWYWRPIWRWWFKSCCSGGRWAWLYGSLPQWLLLYDAGRRNSPTPSNSIGVSAAKFLLHMREGRQVSQIAIADIIAGCNSLCNQALTRIPNKVRSDLISSGIDCNPLPSLTDNFHVDLFGNIKSNYLFEKYCVEHFGCLVSLCRFIYMFTILYIELYFLLVTCVLIMNVHVFTITKADVILSNNSNFNHFFLLYHNKYKDSITI